jgi:O-antigen ligase
MAFSGLMQLLAMLAFGLTVNRIYLRKGPPLKHPRLFNLMVLGNALGILFAAERSAWLGVIAALFLCTFLLSFRLWARTSAFMLVLAVVLWFTVPVVQQRLTPLTNWQTDVSFRVRVSLWRESLEIFKQKPLFGVGIRNFPHHYIAEALGQGHAAIDHAHSNYMQMLATTGLVGSTAYLYLWFCVFSTAIRRLPLSKGRSKIEPFYCKAQNWTEETGIDLGILAGVVSVLVSGIFEYNFGTASVRMAQWFFIAMLIRPNHKVLTHPHVKGDFSESLPKAAASLGT